MDAVGQKESPRQSKKRFWKDYQPTEKMTFVMAVFTVIYALITAGLYRISAGQLEGMKKDQRPWMKMLQSSNSATPAGGPSPSTPNSTPPNSAPNLGAPSGAPSSNALNSGWPEKTIPLSFPLRVTNVGKTPAKDVEADFFIEIVRNGQNPLLNKSISVGQYTTGVVFPNDPVDTPVFYTLLQADWEDVKAGRSFIVVYSHMSYRDVFRSEHWTDYCQFTSPMPGAYSAKKCTDYNSTDDE